MGHTTEINFKGELLVLSALRAIFWPRRQTLIVADMHLGKSAYFRKNGIPIPSSVMTNDLQRLSALIELYRPQRVLVAGDMFHHDFNVDILYFKEWRESYQQVSFLLVPGNHDRMLEIDYGRLQIALGAAEYEDDPFLFRHEMPEPHTSLGMISGHIHPGYTMEGRARQSLRLPCFITTEDYIILPAFSSFTGLCRRPDNGRDEKYFVIAGESIFSI